MRSPLSKSRRVLYLPLKAEYFDAIKSGAKRVEYRVANDYWKRRIEGREYDEIVLTKGYPSRTDKERRLSRPWRSWWMETVTHKHFGPKPVRTYAIQVNP